MVVCSRLGDTIEHGRHHASIVGPLVWFRFAKMRAPAPRRHHVDSSAEAQHHHMRHASKQSSNKADFHCFTLSSICLSILPSFRSAPCPCKSKLTCRVKFPCCLTLLAFAALGLRGIARTGCNEEPPSSGRSAAPVSRAGRMVGLNVFEAQQQRTSCTQMMTGTTMVHNCLGRGHRQGILERHLPVQVVRVFFNQT